ncbi:response regulator transcription factor [Pseudomonas deceptionensis]|uniref:DNA-binding response regulator, OmpR family, contains REC and winged-helix (WHTH) domain n=1 Tax=Pseudomonas deceptionensis TaxID=882211 RepID=A0A0J6GIE3_PSEDM|nr:response regulator transcription factor [Pseudomonas deceptionensis]KMM81455.1 transcriptional regulator [Pseudomonas deceptionensis]SEE74521.1 DNA-binding response regulator, OmpR family, contains REC and winged-helix (wHTH) domain [Pseudomonas deceptionensis]
MNPVPVSPSRLLTIEDDPVLGAYLHEQLERCGFDVIWCQNGPEGLALARQEHFDVVLMDILLPGMNGLQVLTQLRQTHALPVILMSALGAEADRISGFQLGADDYLPKPFSMAELRVRIQAILRRVALDRMPDARVPQDQPPVGTGLFFDEDTCDVRHDQLWAGLTRSEYRLLDTLQRSADEVLSKAFLYQQVLQRGYAAHDRSLDMHISQIRRKLKTIGYHQREVRTVWGKGYVLSASDAL